MLILTCLGPHQYKRKSHNPTIQNLYVAFWSRLTINDVLISLERFGEAKDEGLLASHLRGLLLVDSPTQAKSVSSGTKMLALTQSERFPADGGAVCISKTDYILWRRDIEYRRFSLSARSCSCRSGRKNLRPSLQSLALKP